MNVTSIGKLHYKDRTIDTGFTETIEPMHLKDGLGDLFGLLREEMPPKDACKRLSEELGRGDCEYLEYDRLITNKAIEWIRKQKKREKQDSPWVLFVSFVSPHYPLIAPPDFYDLYNDANLPYDNYQNLSKNKLHSWVKGIRESWPYDDYMDEEKEKLQCKPITVCVVLWTQMWVNCSRNLNNVIYMMILQLFMQVITESHSVIEGFGER